MAQLADNHALLIYRIGPVLCCAPTRPVETLIQPPPLTRPPGSSNSHPGIFRHDGKLVSLIEVRQLFGVEEQDRSQPGRIIICHLDDRYTGFQVDQIIDVIDTPTNGWGQLSPSLSGGVFTRSLLLDNKIHLYTEFEKLHKLRNDGWLKPWLEHLHKQARIQEKERPYETTSTAAVNRMPISAETAKESTRTPPPPAEASASDSMAGSGINLQPTSDTHTQSTPQAKPDRRSKDLQPGTHIHSTVRKITTQKIGSQTEKKPENKKRQTATSATVVQPANPLSITRISTAQAPIAQASGLTERSPTPEGKPVPAPLLQTAHPAASDSGYDASDSSANTATGHKNKAGTNLTLIIVLLIGTGLIAALVYLWPNHNPDPVKITALKIPAVTPQFKDPTATELYIRPEQGETVINKSSYHADIEQQSKEHGANEITIILTAPADDEVIRTNADSHRVREQPAEIRSAPVTFDLSADEREGQKHEQGTDSTAVQRIDEVVHTVVRGDTLWHIAQRYIHNPFRYPELARLNKIHNPDLIYPGDRVRIIRIYRQPVPVSAN